MTYEQFYHWITGRLHSAKSLNEQDIEGIKKVLEMVKLPPVYYPVPQQPATPGSPYVVPYSNGGGGAQYSLDINGKSNVLPSQTPEQTLQAIVKHNAQCYTNGYLIINSVPKYSGILNAWW